MEARDMEKQAAQNLNTAMLDIIHEPIVVTGSDQQVFFGNKAFIELVGATGQIEGVPISSLLLLDPGSASQALSSGEYERTESWATIRGKRFYFEILSNPYYDETGKIMRIIQLKNISGQKTFFVNLQNLIDRMAEWDLSIKSTRYGMEAPEDCKSLLGSVNHLIDQIFFWCDWYEEIINAVPFKISITDLDKNWAIINRAAESLGVTNAEIQANRQTAGSVSTNSQIKGSLKCNKWKFNICNTENCALIKLRNGETRSVFEHDGSYFQVDTAFTHNLKGEQVGHVEVFQDITPSVRAKAYQKTEIERLANNLGMLTRGKLEFDLAVANGDEHTILERENFMKIAGNLIEVRDAVNALIADSNMFAQSAVDGRLTTRADVTKHEGAYREIVEGVNHVFDAMIEPVNEAADCLKAMASGNLDVEMRGDYKGDYAVIKESLNATLTSLNDILNQASVAVDQVATGARQVSDSSQSLSQAATESASSLEEITASMHELTAQTNMNAENATQANQLAAQAKISAEKGEGQMGNMVKAMNDINESATSISKIIKAIDEIAFQTNLLALNAAVEAARAGKHGKGFTVVAEEVRNLAQRSAAAAKETAEMIEGSIKKTGVGTKIAEETAKALEEIVAGSAKVTDLIGEIASASKEQAQGIGQINTGLSQVDQVTQQVTANSEESASASEELSSQSLQLKQMLSKFKLRKQGFDMAALGLPEGITPEMIQMLKSMLQSKQRATAPGGQPKKGAKTRPSDINALDDDDFGMF